MINAYINNYYQHITINKCLIGFQRRKLLIVVACRDYNVVFKILLCYKVSIYFYVNWVNLIARELKCMISKILICYFHQWRQTMFSSGNIKDGDDELLLCQSNIVTIYFYNICIYNPPCPRACYAMRDMMIAVGTRNMVTNPLSWSSKSAVEPADKNKGFKSRSSLE